MYNKKLLDKVPYYLSPANVTSTASGLVLQTEKNKLRINKLKKFLKGHFTHVFKL